MTTKEIAEQLYPTTPRGNELPNTIELQRYVYVQKAKQAAYLACATKYISEIEARDKKIEELEKENRQRLERLIEHGILPKELLTPPKKGE